MRAFYDLIIFFCTYIWNFEILQDLVSRLDKFVELKGHSYTSFNPSGDLLVCGSADSEQIIRLWEWASKTQILTYDSGYDDDVLQARVIPYSDDRTIVSCAADGQVCWTFFISFY